MIAQALPGEQRVLGKRLDARPGRGCRLTRQRIGGRGVHLAECSQQQRRRSVDVQGGVGGQQRHPGLQPLQQASVNARQQAQLAQFLQRPDLAQLQRRQFEQLEQARPTVEGDLVHLPLAQQRIEIEAPGEVIDIDSDLRIFNVETRRHGRPALNPLDGFFRVL
ncbi:hypothetical protein D3C86_1572920 [compost metagenome]